MCSAPCARGWKSSPVSPIRRPHLAHAGRPGNARRRGPRGLNKNGEDNWIIQSFEALRPRHLIHSWGFAAMGFGAKLAAPDRPCIAVVGDGSFLMTPHALATAVEYNIPVVWVAWNNYGYRSIRDIQYGMFGGRELATGFQSDRTGELYSPDFAMLAKSFGVASHTVTRADEVEDALTVAIAADRPYLIEVPVDREIRPIGHRKLGPAASAAARTELSQGAGSGRTVAIAAKFSPSPCGLRRSHERVSTLPDCDAATVLLQSPAWSTLCNK
jgi:hypothetical protein